VRGTGRDDEVVVRDLALVEHHGATRDVDVLHVRHPHLDVPLIAEHVPDRRRDVGGRERRGRDLVEQRLEQVMIATVDQRDANRRTPQCAGAAQPGEAAAQNDDVRSGVGGHCGGV
jgi:hypothetical protein